jgi:hypothetical protein
MGDLIGHILEGVLQALVRIADWIPAHRWDSIRAAWAWPIASCLTIGFTALIASFYLGHPWLFQLFVGASVGAFGLVFVAALCSKGSRDG